MENQPDRLKEIHKKWYAIPAGRSDSLPPIEGDDISWLLAEVERLRQRVSSVPVAEIESLRVHGDQDDSSSIAHAADVVYVWLRRDWQ